MFTRLHPSLVSVAESIRCVVGNIPSCDARAVAVLVSASGRDHEGIMQVGRMHQPVCHGEY
jgi:hypothetical protein